MALTPERAVKVLQSLEFHLYHGKSSGESLLVHSLSVYTLVHEVLSFTRIYSDADKELMRWAALLHDYGKRAPHWQKAKRGSHRVTLGDTTYKELRVALEAGIAEHSSGVLGDADIDDILFVVEFHHASGRSASTPSRSRMKDVVSECDRAVSQYRISDGLVQALNAIVDTVRYKLFIIELIDHPISPLIIGAFDYVLKEGGSIQPLLYSPTSTLYIGPLNLELPPIDEVNRFLNEQLRGGKGVLRYDGGNARVYTDERSFIELASDPDAFIQEATAYANQYCARQRKAAEKDPERWSDEKEDAYLYGRVCGTTYNTLLELCGVPNNQRRPACLTAGGRYGEITAADMRLLGFRRSGTSYEQTLREVLNQLKPSVDKTRTSLYRKAPEDTRSEETFPYDARELLVPDTSAYDAGKPLDPKGEAARDYARYMKKEPLAVCPACSQFPQGNVSAAAFPQGSPLGGTVEVFYTTYMRLIKKEMPGNKGVSFCSWCSKCWDLIATDADDRRQLYRLCIMPHHLFARLEWREILGPEAGGLLVELGAPGTISASGVYPHIAVMALRGQNREAVLREVVADRERGEEQIIERLYKYGLKSAVIVTNPTSSRHLLTCGSISIDTAEWPLLRRPLRLLNSTRRTYASAITALQHSPYAFGTFLADGSIKGTEKEVEAMVVELGERTGLAFLRDIWIGEKNRVDNAGKVIRGMNETLRRLKESEDDASLIDAMAGKGLHLALTTREGRYRPLENRDREEGALRLAAQKLLVYRDQTYRRTELVRAMIYTLAYFSRPEPNPESADAGTAVTGPEQSAHGGANE